MIPDECQQDFDGDTLVDGCDPDIDNDGVPNDADRCDLTPPGLPMQPEGHVRGDFNLNCVIDLADLASMLSCVNRGGPQFEADRVCRLNFDYDFDYFVDLRDVAVFTNLFDR
jgi:hypothetical protein